MVADAERLDAGLRDLAADVEFPRTPDVVSGVARRLASPQPHRLRWRPAFVAALAATLVLAATVAALAFGLPGLRLTFVESLPPAATDGLGSSLSLGDRVGLDVARDRAAFPVAVPEELGAPDGVYVSADGDAVSLVYVADSTLPALPGSDVGALVMELAGSVGADHVQKLVRTHDSTVLAVSVNGSDGYWIEGEPHVLLYEDQAGIEREVTSRLVGDVLVWHADGVLYRIESAIGLDRSIEIAESMRAP